MISREAAAGRRVEVWTCYTAGPALDQIPANLRPWATTQLAELRINVRSACWEPAIAGSISRNGYGVNLPCATSTTFSTPHNRGTGSAERVHQGGTHRPWRGAVLAGTTSACWRMKELKPSESNSRLGRGFLVLPDSTDDPHSPHARAAAQCREGGVGAPMATERRHSGLPVDPGCWRNAASRRLS